MLLLMRSEAMLDKTTFSVALNRAIGKVRDSEKIGTLGEKLLHRTLKYYFEPDESKHEIACFGSVADIRNEKGIIEIQTRSFSKLSPKLERFLPEERVTIVYPIIENKFICRINTETGESLTPRKSPKRGRVSDALAEISMIRRFVPDDRLTVLVIMVDLTETRMQNREIRVGRKRTSKLNAIPMGINRIISLDTPDDYRQLLPADMPQSFTAEEFEKLFGFKKINAHGALMLLLQLGILTRERKGREPYTYSLNNA